MVDKKKGHRLPIPAPQSPSSLINCMLLKHSFGLFFLTFKFGEDVDGRFIYCLYGEWRD